jgi:lysophospholipase L1-like esterase
VSDPVRPTLGRRLSFVLWTVVASLVLLELVLQVAALFFKAPPAALGEHVDPDAIRVLAVGDSWVEGAEAAQGQGFVDHLDRELSAIAGGAAVQVFNLGRTGANSAHVALTTLDEAERIRPALILVLVGQNNATNFYRVAEVEERIGEDGGRSRLIDRSRVVKLARILLANARGGSDYREGDEEGDEEVTPAPLPELVWDDQGRPVITAPLLITPTGAHYLRRELEQPPETGSHLRDLAWRVLFNTARRDLDAAQADAAELAVEFGWPATAAGPSAPLAATETELLARYAMLRLARARRDWRSVRYHGGAAIGYEPRGTLCDLASAEAHLLAGDWRTARRLLLAAHNRAPGLVDTVDLAGRFPEQARDPDIYEALEFQPAAEVLPAWEQADVVERALFDPEGAAPHRYRWLEERPDDQLIRIDLAVWLLANGRRAEADALAGVAPGLLDDRVPHPPTADLGLWRFHVSRALFSGDRDYALEAVSDALEVFELGADAPLLRAMAEALSAHSSCDQLPAVADRWFAASADANGYSRVLAPCMEPGEAARRLARLRPAWGPLGDEQAWTALVRAGRRPFDLLYRDLDLVVAEASRLDADVVLLNYPNPSDDHTALRDILADYASTRPVVYIDLWGRFEARFDVHEWQARLGPNGHCNAAGYREMADGILEELVTRGLMAGPEAGE